MWFVLNWVPNLVSARSRPFVSLAATLLLSATVLLAAPCVGLAQPEGRKPPGDSAASYSSGGNRARSALSLQAGGGSFMAGLQYHHRWADNWVGRAGIGGGAIVNPLFFLDETEEITDEDIIGVVGVPLGASWVPGSGDVRPEVGLSVAPGLIDGAIPALWGGPSVGVRYHPLEGGLFVRAVGQGLVGTAEGETLGTLWVGFSVGYAF